MEINIEDYLTDDEVKEIIASEVREQTRHAFNSKRLDPNTLLQNAGHYAVFSAIDEHIGENGYAKKQVERETRRVINELSAYSVFGDRGNYPHYRTSVAQKHVDEATEKHRDIIDKRVIEGLEDISARLDGAKINEFITEVVRNALDDAAGDS